MASYEHSQSQNVLAPTLFVLGIVLLISGFASGAELWFLFTPVTMLVVSLIGHALSKLTTTVTSETVEAAFRWGWPKRSVPLVDIKSARVVRNKWWYGIGVRLIPGHTTMFNIWGLDAVHLDLNGTRNFRIGTNDPEGLAAAINGELGA